MKNFLTLQNKTKAAIFSLFAFTSFALHAYQVSSVRFFGVACKDAEKNMISMTEDLYYKQIQELGVSITDERSDSFSTEYFVNGDDFFSTEGSGDIFFAIIKKLSSGKWECTINLKEENSGKIHKNTKLYDSYFKILMESKNSVKEIIEGFSSSSNQSEENAATEDYSYKTITTESIAGTWIGEEYINKIVILKGGRGFIIFKNGASMNVSVQISKNEKNEDTALITQVSGNNASFYPELDRKTALELAIDASPLSWSMTITKNGNLKGNKTTFIQNSSAEKPKQTQIPVEWKRL